MMRLVRVAAWILFGAAGGAAAQGVKQGLQGHSPRPLDVKLPPVPKAQVTGRVLCGDTRQPARGATVMLVPLRGQTGELPGKPAVGRVALGGQYVIEHVAPGSYAVLAFFPGYLSAYDDPPESRTGETPGDGEARYLTRLKAGDVVRVKRFQGGSLAVTVLDRDTDGVVLALVEDRTVTKPPGPGAPEEED